MEKTPKSKFLSFKSKRRISETLVRNWLDSSSEKSFISPSDVNDLENLPVIAKDVLKTPEVKGPLEKDEQAHGECRSPQFRVGWNDGSEQNDLDMDSPVSIVPVQRRIRRCPDSVLHRASRPNRSASSEKKTDPENDCDILQCVSWAKNLLESTGLDKEDSLNSRENDGEKSDITGDTCIDILDDSTNELMILCSQAVEQNLPLLNDSTKVKRTITPNHEHNEKRLKLGEMSCNLSRNLMFDPEKKAKDDSVLLSSSKSNQKSRDFINQSGDNSCNNLKSSSVLNCSVSNNNNNNNKLDFNYQNIEKQNQNGMKSYQPTFTKNNVIPKILDSSAANDPFKSFLDDEDDFSSLDFNFLDSLQSNICGSSNKSVVVSAPKPPVRYTKEQIEKRRIEAKKRLLFNKKHRSM